MKTAALWICSRRWRNERIQNFGLDETNLPDVIRICQLVDGLPLGLELAASWVRALSVEEVRLQAEHSLSFLSSSDLDMEERHRSMEAVLEQTWRLLDEPERLLLEQFSVFRGGFTFHAAASITGATPEQTVGLIDKSVLRFGRRQRYDLHPLLQQFAAAKTNSHSRTANRDSGSPRCLLCQLLASAREGPED